MKYLGSKNRIAKEILPIILQDRKEGQCFVDVFAGGMNLVDKVDGNRIANDINPYLIAMWKGLADGTFTIPEFITREEYKKIKDRKDAYDLALIGWVGFNCSYSGKFFQGYAGKVMTKTGVERNYQAEAIRNTMKQVDALRGVSFMSEDYKDLYIPDNSIIYCDPPYSNTTSYGTRETQCEINTNEFFQWCRDMKQKGHSVFVSEYNCPDDFHEVWHKEVKSSLSANGKSGESKQSIEKLFVIKN